MHSTAFSDADLAAVAASLGSPLVAAAAVGWGDARSTLRLALADGREFAARCIPEPDSSLARRIASTMILFADAGLPTARPALTSTAEATWLSVPWVDGTTGAAWLGEAGRARRLADRMGELVGRIGRIDPASLGSVAPLDHGEDQVATIEAWLATAALGPTIRQAVTSAVGRCGAAERRPSTVIHGDFAPINVIVDADGKIAALLDLEHARLGPPHADVAWWGWVVRHHHPEAWAAAWRTFRSAAGVDAGVSDADLHAQALLELARRAASAANEEARQRWEDRLADAATWTVAGSDQPT